MNRKRLSQIQKIAKEAELTKKAQEVLNDVSNADDAETAFNKVLDSLIDNMEIPALDEV